MSTYEAVQNSKNMQEALLHIAASLDLILDNQEVAQTTTDSWGVWDNEITAPLSVVETEPTVELDVDGNNVITLPVVSAAQQQKRRELAETLGMEHESWYTDEHIDAYVKGGAYWLYSGNREFVMSLPETTRRILVQDVADAGMTEQAWEMQRDVLKEGAGASAEWARSTEFSND